MPFEGTNVPCPLRVDIVTPLPFLPTVTLLLISENQVDLGQDATTLRGVHQPPWNVDGMRPTTIQRSWQWPAEASEQWL